MERWFVTGPLPRMQRWWTAQTARTKVAIAVAALFALASMLNLASTGLARAIATGPVPVASSAKTAPVAVLLEETAPADARKTWVVNKVWQGSGSRETEEFTVGEHWRVDWLFSPAPSGGSLQVFIFQSDGRLLMTIAANTKKGGADTSFWAGPGKYFLKINSSGGDWKLAVQDLR